MPAFKELGGVTFAKPRGQCLAHTGSCLSSAVSGRRMQWKQRCGAGKSQLCPGCGRLPSSHRSTENGMSDQTTGSPRGCSQLVPSLLFIWSLKSSYGKQLRSPQALLRGCARGAGPPTAELTLQPPVPCPPLQTLHVASSFVYSFDHD